MKLSVLIPVFNEAPSIDEVVRRVAAVSVPKEIIVVDDASTDSTLKRLKAMSIEDLKVLTHSENRGKGAAVRTAMAAASGDAVIIQDADLEYYPEDYTDLLQALQDEEVAAVYGVRDLTGQPIARRVGNRVLTIATNLLFGSHLHDMETCYKMIRTDVAQSLELSADRFDIEPEITVRLMRGGHRIAEVPIRYAPREKRKLNPWRDGPHALWTLVKLRFLADKPADPA